MFAPEHRHHLHQQHPSENGVARLLTLVIKYIACLSILLCIPASAASVMIKEPSPYPRLGKVNFDTPQNKNILAANNAVATNTANTPPQNTSTSTTQLASSTNNASSNASSQGEASNALQKAKQLMQDGMPAQAYALLEHHEFEQAGDIDFDYIIGIAALDSGKADKATLALERVLAQDPNLAGARLDMARAWYVLGDFARARQELQILSNQNPPQTAHEMIKQLQAAIDGSELGTKRSRKWNGYVETGIGYDNNVTSVVDDFTTAILRTHGLPDFEPTGAAVKRSSSVLFLRGGADVSQHINDDWDADMSVDAKWRSLPHSQRYSNGMVEMRGGLQYKIGSQKWRFGLELQQYWQETDTPTMNHRSRSLFLQWQKRINDDNQVSVMLSGGLQHYFDAQNYDSSNSNLNISWLHQFAGDWRPSISVAASVGHDRAKYLLFNLKNNDKDSAGLRASFQISPYDNIDVYGGIGLTQRRDRDFNAHSDFVAYGRDRMSDANFGIEWRAKNNWSVRTQWNYTRNDSNIAVNEYRRNEISAALRFDFQ